MTASLTLLDRRRMLLGAAAVGVALLSPGALAAGRPLAITVHKDPNCGCCTAWVKAMQATGRFAPRIVEPADIMAVKTRLRVPTALASCHTSLVGGYVIEGHVPPADVTRLLRQRPTGIVGLAVPGMPAGSPGMEMPDGRRDPYSVLAFTATGKSRIFSRHA